MGTLVGSGLSLAAHVSGAAACSGSVSQLLMLCLSAAATALYNSELLTVLLERKNSGVGVFLGSLGNALFRHDCQKFSLCINYNPADE